MPGDWSCPGVRRAVAPGFPRVTQITGTRREPGVGYWERGYDWRRLESGLSRFPQFLTEIDGLDIHFIHVRSENPGAMPLILTHGWPGSVVEFLKLIGPLTDPVPFGGVAADPFDVVVPSLPRRRLGWRRHHRPRGHAT